MLLKPEKNSVSVPHIMVGFDSVGISTRLRRLRALYNLSQKQMAEDRLGIREETYQMAEKSGALSRDIAHRIRLAFPGITLDWLYYGDADYLPPPLQRALQGIQDVPPAPSRRRR